MTKGKVAVLSPWPVSEETRDYWRNKFPNFDFIFQVKPWGEPRTVETIPDEEWRKVVALLTPSTLPTPEQVPKLQFVQLTSAGANMIIDKPLYTDTDITFTSAKGAYEYVHFVLGFLWYNSLTRFSPQIAEWAISTFIALRHHRKSSRHPNN